MTFREVYVTESLEVLRLWLRGEGATRNRAARRRRTARRSAATCEPPRPSRAAPRLLPAPDIPYDLPVSSVPAR